MNVLTQLLDPKLLHHVVVGYHVLPQLHPGGEGLGGGAGVSLKNILILMAGRMVMIILMTSAWFNLRWIERSDPSDRGCGEGRGQLGNIMIQLQEMKLLHRVIVGYHMLPLLHPGGEGLGGGAGVSLDILILMAGRMVMIILMTSAWFFLRWIVRSDPSDRGGVVGAEASLGTVALRCFYSLYLCPAWCLAA